MRQNVKGATREENLHWTVHCLSCLTTMTQAKRVLSIRQQRIHWTDCARHVPYASCMYIFIAQNASHPTNIHTRAQNRNTKKWIVNTHHCNAMPMCRMHCMCESVCVSACSKNIARARGHSTHTHSHTKKWKHCIIRSLHISNFSWMMDGPRKAMCFPTKSSRAMALCIVCMCILCIVLKIQRRCSCRWFLISNIEHVWSLHRQETMCPGQAMTITHRTPPWIPMNRQCFWVNIQFYFFFVLLSSECSNKKQYEIRDCVCECAWW